MSRTEISVFGGRTGGTGGTGAKGVAVAGRTSGGLEGVAHLSRTFQSLDRCAGCGWGSVDLSRTDISVFGQVGQVCRVWLGFCGLEPH